MDREYRGRSSHGGRAASSFCHPSEGIIRGMNADTDSIYEELWRLLEEGSSNRRHPFHTPVLATSMSSGDPDLRTVVLRRVDRGRRLVCCHTDARSPKVGRYAAPTEWRGCSTIRKLGSRSGHMVGARSIRARPMPWLRKHGTRFVQIVESAIQRPIRRLRCSIDGNPIRRPMRVISRAPSRWPMTNRLSPLRSWQLCLIR